MNNGRMFDLIATVIILVGGVFTAWITFGILDSQAEIDSKGYTVGGALAGALITMSLLTSVYKQFRSSSGELEELREDNARLQQKLIRGAPKPENFTTEINEKQKIVLARPEEWSPKGGVIFDFEVPEHALKEGDKYPAHFTLSYAIRDDDADSADDLYNKLRESIDDIPTYTNFSHQYTDLGGHSSAIRSLKCVWKEQIRLRIQVNMFTGKRSLSEEPVFPGEPAQEIPVTEPLQVEPENEDQSGELSSDLDEVYDPFRLFRQHEEHIIDIWHVLVVCCVESEGIVYFFDFRDSKEDFDSSSHQFNQLLNSTRFLY